MLETGRLRKFMLLTIATSALSFGCKTAGAFEYQFNNGVAIRFDNTIEYSVGERTAPESSFIANDLNANDGDNNLRSGIISNRVDLLTKFDISDAGYGFDTTIDSFYDTIYNQATRNNDPYSYNPASEPPSKFTSETRTRAGRDIELRNLFVYGQNSIAGIPITVRVGRLVNIFGESLFFAGNGISYGTSPIDVLRALSVPNTQAKDLFLPVGQAMVTAQLTNSISATGYYKFEWEKDNLPPEGSYFSDADLLDEGGQRIIAFEGSATSPGGYFYRGPDQTASSNGQFGLAVHYDPQDANFDLGFYALQYNETAPQVYTKLAAGAPTFIPGTPNALAIGTYQLVYPEHIQIYGVSASTTYGATNFAGEISARTNDPLNSSVTMLSNQTANNSNDSLYAVGNTLHYQASAIYLGPGTPLWAASSWLTEIAGDSLLGFTKNRDNFDRSYKHTALGLRTLFTAEYFHVLPGLDLNVPVGLGWDFMGLAPDTVAFNNYGIDRGGDLSVGVSGTYLNKWIAGITYTYYIAPPGRDLYADRDFVSFSIQRTF